MAMPGSMQGEPTVGESVAAGEGRRQSYYVEIFAVSFAALLLEISYTRIISFKLFYYYTYLVIGLALLGIGTGGVIVAISKRVQRAETEAILAWATLVGGLSVGLGYLVIAVTKLDTIAIWDYGTRTSFANLARLVLICVALFASFVSVGVVVAVLFARRTESIGRLYFADLLGAGLACAIVVSLLGWIGPPSTILLAGALLGVVGLRIALRTRSRLVGPAVGLVLVLAIVAVWPRVLPEQKLEASKQQADVSDATFSSWSPLFRIDVYPALGVQLLFHDGLLGSEIDAWDGDVGTLGRFDSDPRALPFAALGEAPRDELIIGAAGGHEVLASLYFDAAHIDAVELNPVTYDLVTERYADYAGNIADHPAVNYVRDEGRSFLARQDGRYDLVWYPAPDSYSATNAATAGAFVLSESYLYTSEAIQDTMDHLNDGGLLAAQFGEYDYARRPNRTTRYVATARAALRDLGVAHTRGHIIVITTEDVIAGTLATVLVKKAPFTEAEIQRVVSTASTIPGSVLAAAPGASGDGGPVEQLLRTPTSQLDDWYAHYPYDVRPVTDDRPFFWHFSQFDDVISQFGDPIINNDREIAVGERVLVLLLLVATVLAALFLILPFFAIRDRWRALPRKATSAAYFAVLGLGFIFFEITLIQRLTLFLGYPTYSLTVTLMSVLLFTGIGALLSGRYRERPERVAPILLGVLAALTVFYLFALVPLTDGLLTLPLVLRFAFAIAVIAPLGICLGAFMPLGLGSVSRISDGSSEYVAWGWAVNGFASVVGSVASTILAIAFGFQVVLLVALALYVVAVILLRRIGRPISVGPAG